jgi:C-terminal processing protease CtpA/Prc
VGAQTIRVIRRFGLVGLACLGATLASGAPVSGGAAARVSSTENVLLDDPVVGIGVALRLTPDDEYPIVFQLVPNGPVAEDGHINVGDELIGIEEEEGKVYEFKGKLLMDVVNKIRGPVDTKIKLVVRHKGEEGRKTYELTRKPLP